MREETTGNTTNKMIYSQILNPDLKIDKQMIYKKSHISRMVAQQELGLE